MAELLAERRWDEREDNQRAARAAAREMQVSALSEMTGVAYEACEDVLRSWGGDVDAALEVVSIAILVIAVPITLTLTLTLTRRCCS